MTARTRTRLRSLCLCAALGLTACGFDACGFDEAPSGEACVPGMRTDCACRGGMLGGQTCRDDGTFGACECILPADLGGSTANASGSPDGGPSSAGASGGKAGMSGGGSAGTRAGAGSGAAGAGAAGANGGSGGTSGGAGTAAAGAGGSGNAGQGGSGATACKPDALACGMMLAVPWVTRCNAEGTKMEPDHACESYESCRDGACHCIAKRAFCVENELRQCDAAGKTSEVLQTCTDHQTCNAPLRMCQAVCTPDDCSCEGSQEPCCTAGGLCGCTGFLGVSCTPPASGDAKQCTCG